MQPDTIQVNNTTAKQHKKKHIWTSGYKFHSIGAGQAIKQMSSGVVNVLFRAKNYVTYFAIIGP